MKKLNSKLVLAGLIVIVQFCLSSRILRADYPAPKCGYELKIGEITTWVPCKRLWCESNYQYDGCKTSGNGIECDTQESCPQ